MALSIQRDPDRKGDFQNNFAWEVDPDADALVRNMVRMATAAIEKGDLREAEGFLREGLARDPSDGHCRAYLAVCVAARAGQFTKAEQMARGIIREHPYDPVGHAALGLVYLNAGRRRAAFQSFARARELAPADGGMNDRLDRLEPRRDPVLRFLPRNHALNIWLGRLRSRLKG